ncbi:hypothetical protein GGI07_000864 [Coemansia sp. Benny D115]|nr:hypothetical protein GGI07_000864 [Coemansia sp. Benny D115]
MSLTSSSITADGGSMPSLDDLVSAIQQQNEWSFVVSSQWIVTIQTLAAVSLICSLGVLAFVSHIMRKHRQFLRRLSLRISAYVAAADVVSAVVQLVMLQNDLMIKLNTHSLRLVLWLSMFSTLLPMFLTLCISVQLHLSTLTHIRVGVYMRMERYYAGASVLAATILPAIAVAQMQGIFWVPYMHAFNWPAESWTRRLILWMCCYVWIILTIIYCSGVAACLALRIWALWQSSVEIVTAPRMPEKWDWSRLTASGRDSDDTMKDDSASTIRSTTGYESRSYLVTLTATDRHTHQPVAVRSYVDKRRFLLSIQRLACYPLVPVLTQLGVVAMNMTEQPSKGLYIYGTVMASTGGLLNLAVFLLNPALPDIWREAALKETI